MTDRGLYLLTPRLCICAFAFIFCVTIGCGFSFQEHLDYDLVRSSNPEFKKAMVRVNVYKQHRQTIQVGI